MTHNAYHEIAAGLRQIASGVEKLADESPDPVIPIDPDPVDPVDPVDPTPSDKTEWLLHVNCASDWDSNLVYGNLVRESRFLNNVYLLPEVAKDIPDGVLSNEWVVENHSKEQIRIAGIDKPDSSNNLFVPANTEAFFRFHPNFQARIVSPSDPGSIKIYHASWRNDAPKYNPIFLDSLKGFKGFRSLDWILTNNVENATWGNRKKPEQVDQARRSTVGGCWEDWFELGEINGNKYAWVNIPHRYTDEAIVELAGLAARTNQHVILEFGNECWNPGQPYNINQRHCFDIGGGNDAKGYGIESQRVWDIFEQAYGANFTRVCCWQAVAGVKEYETVLRNAPGCQAFATARYIGSRRFNGQWEGSKKFLEGGVDKALSRMPEAIESTFENTDKLTSFCKAKGVRPFAYEMGNHLLAPSHDELPKLLELLRHPAYEEHYRKYLNTFNDAGIEVAGILTHIQEPRRQVSFGQQHYLGDQSPQWKAIQSVIHRR